MHFIELFLSKEGGIVALKKETRHDLRAKDEFMKTTGGYLSKASDAQVCNSMDMRVFNHPCYATMVDENAEIVVLLK